MIWGLISYLLIAAGAGIMLGPMGGLGEQIGWAFYRRAMRSAARKRVRRELMRYEMATVMSQYRTVPLAYLEPLHAHAHTMASLTGQAYLVTVQQVSPVMVPDDPRHSPWVVLPPS